MKGIAIFKLLIAAVAFLIMRVMQEEINEQKQQIDKLHYENENYLKILSDMDVLPKDKANQKIKQMNEKYGEVKLRIK